MSLSILRLDSSINGAASQSRELTDQAIAKLLAANPGAQITTRDLAENPVPMIDSAWLAAVNTPAETRTDAQNAIADLSDELIAEVQAADIVVIGVPVYNFTIPTQLNAWIDQITRAKVTFQYGENGPEGLIKNTRAIVVLASGGTKLNSPIDFASTYLNHMLGFVGITDVTYVAADAMFADRDAALENAQASLNALAA